MEAGIRFLELARMRDEDLERLFASARGPDLDSLAGCEWRGYNTPWFAAALGIRKFIKGFFRLDRGVEGYNIPVVQNGLEGPWLAKPSRENPKRFGFYLVGRVNPGSRDSLYPAALLLDYGASPRNPWYRVERVLRDYLVQDPQNRDILIGKAYLALGPRVPSNFFLLEKLRPTAWSP